MQKNSSKTAQENFEIARENLAAALKNLEEIIAKKIEEALTNTNMLNALEGDESSLQLKVIEQTNIIQKLSDELNKIQKIGSEIEKENDFLKDKNRFFADKIFKFKTQGSNLIQAVELDISRVRDIIKNQ